MSEHHANVDAAEINKFSELASRWWDKNSEFKPLHEINPLRLEYIKQQCNGSLQGKKILDIGCGGGILAESLCKEGAIVTAIDMAEASLEVAKLHLLESKLDIEYLKVPAEEFATQRPSNFDIVCCLETLEHVPDPSSLVAACSALTASGGKVFLSTINRNPKSYLFAIIGAEYILKLLPKGTHEFSKFIKPSEMDSFARATKLTLQDLIGMVYNPLTKVYSLTAKDTSVNYLAYYTK